MTDTEWRMSVAVPLAHTAIGFLKVHKYTYDDVAKFDDEELEEKIRRFMPIHHMNRHERGILIEEVRELVSW